MEFIISKLLKGIIPRILPPAQRYFTYIFIILAIIWLTSANYYYFTQEENKCLGALVSGGIFIGLALISKLWEQIIVRKNLNRNMINDLLAEFYPLIGIKAFEVLKERVSNKKIMKLLSAGVILIAVYFILKQNHKSK